jgi:hypothetical protein
VVKNGERFPLTYVTQLRRSKKQCIAAEQEINQASTSRTVGRVSSNRSRRKPRDLFQRLDVQAIQTNDVLRILNTRWNRLSGLVEECMATGFDMSRKLIKLAKVYRNVSITFNFLISVFQELHRLRNFYSLTAVIQGIELSGCYSTRVQHGFGHLIKPEDNYRPYRRNMDASPALHFLFPMRTAACWEDMTLAATVVSVAKLYVVEYLEQGRFWWLGRFLPSIPSCLGR